jgi:hypothetical protein
MTATARPVFVTECWTCGRTTYSLRRRGGSATPCRRCGAGAGLLRERGINRPHPETARRAAAEDGQK